MINLDHCAQSKIQEPLLISCKVYQKERWKPTGAEIETLKAYFVKNSYPNKDDKNQIIDYMQKNLSSKVEIHQLNRWFQNQRERKLSSYMRSTGKNKYKRFNKKQLEFLEESFAKSSYPKLEEMKMMAGQLSVSLTKVENWFKQNRRALVKLGSFTMKAKKYFNEHELSYLNGAFEKDTHPTKKKTLEMAQRLDCDKLQIKNWFSNKRKKERLVLQTKLQVENLNASSCWALKKKLASLSSLNPISKQNSLLESRGIPLTENSTLSQSMCKSEEPVSRHSFQEPQLYIDPVVSQKNMVSFSVYPIATTPRMNQNLSMFESGNDLLERKVQNMFLDTFKGFNLKCYSLINPIKPVIAKIDNFPSSTLINNDTMISTNIPVSESLGWAMTSNYQIHALLRPTLFNYNRRNYKLFVPEYYRNFCSELSNQSEVDNIFKKENR